MSQQQKQSVESTGSEPTQSNAKFGSESKPQTKKAPGLLQIIQSVLAAMVGIQSDKNRQADFESGYIGNYIFVGIVMVFIFIFTIISVVDSILENAGQ